MLSPRAPGNKASKSRSGFRGWSIDTGISMDVWHETAS